jgi:prepilin-type N-terminal cleavage/methylation domain-containing protein
VKSSVIRNDGGFTLVELLTGLIILAVIIMISFSFFIYQSRMAAATYKKSAGHESVAMALKLVQRDLAHTQNALFSNPELAILATDQANKNDGFYHELYINYSKFLKSQYDTSVPNIFTALGYKLTTEVSGGSFTIDASSEAERKAALANIGCALIARDPFLTGSIQAKIVRGVSGGTGTFPATFTLLDTSGLPANYKLSPAIGYWLVQISDPIGLSSYGALKRFGENIRNNNNVGQTILGGEFQETASGTTGMGQTPTLVINEFRIRCLFVGLDGVTLIWSPPTAFTSLPAANLRYVEVGINYSTQEPMEGFGKTVTVDAVKTMRVSPRLTTLNVAN